MSPSAASSFDWPRILEQNRSWLTRVLRSRIGDCHDVDDVYQEIVVAVLHQARSSGPRSGESAGLMSAGSGHVTVPTESEKIAPWLYRLAIRHVVNFYRRTNRKSHARPFADLNPCARQPQPLDWLMAVEQRQQLISGLAQLSPQDREVLTLKYELNWTYQQMADHLGVPVRNIEYRLMNARKRLRKTLMAMGTTDSMASDRSAIATRNLS